VTTVSAEGDGMPLVEWLTSRKFVFKINDRKSESRSTTWRGT